jgi:hypothetical protein
MMRKFGLVALGLLLSGGIAMAETPAAPPPDSPSEMDESPPPSDRQADADQYRSDDLFCRRDAAARTGYVSPRRAARDEQTRSMLGGTALGAAAGAIIGAATGTAATGAAIGAGAGLLGGTVVGSDNARRASDAVERHYAAAYYDCMAARDGSGGDDDYYGDEARPRPSRYGYADAPPPPPPYPYYPPAYYYPPYYGPSFGPSISFGFGFGGHHHHHWRHHH